MDSFIKNELETFEREVRENLQLEAVRDIDSEENSFFIIKILSIQKDAYRAPFCSIGDNSVTFDDWCWNEYVSDDRLTGRCFTSNSSAFCDRGNALYDGAEI